MGMVMSWSWQDSTGLKKKARELAGAFEHLRIHDHSDPEPMIEVARKLIEVVRSLPFPPPACKGCRGIVYHAPNCTTAVEIGDATPGEVTLTDSETRAALHALRAGGAPGDKWDDYADAIEARMVKSK